MINEDLMKRVIDNAVTGSAMTLIMEDNEYLKNINRYIDLSSNDTNFNNINC